MHSKHILHRDLKPQNVFLTSTGMVKLGDFGISKCLDYSLAKARSVVGTPFYLSPELIQHIPYSYKSDIWSLGVLLYEMTTLKMPFEGRNLAMLAYRIQKGIYEKLSDCWSTDLKELIYSLLNVDPDKRPDIKDILSKFFYY
jgi:NIMA (never in mitosis gene a)-related kinase